MTEPQDNSLQPEAAGLPAVRCAGLIAVAAATYTAYETLAGPCQAAGCSCVWEAAEPSAARAATAGLWDAAGQGPAEMEDLKRFAWALHPAPVIAVLGFPRSDDRAAALAAGAASIVSKPFLLEDLLWR